MLDCLLGCCALCGLAVLLRYLWKRLRGLPFRMDLRWGWLTVRIEKPEQH